MGIKNFVINKSISNAEEHKTIFKKLTHRNTVNNGNNYNTIKEIHAANQENVKVVYHEDFDTQEAVLVQAYSIITNIVQIHC